jgi:hypothetical protein
VCGYEIIQFEMAVLCQTKQTKTCARTLEPFTFLNDTHYFFNGINSSTLYQFIEKINVLEMLRLTFFAYLLQFVNLFPKGSMKKQRKETNRRANVFFQELVHVLRNLSMHHL